MAGVVDIFAPGAAQAAVLVSMRLTGLVIIAPVFSARTIPVKIKTTLVILLTIAMLGVAWDGPAATVNLTVINVITETIIGFGIGFGAALLVAAAETAGDLLSVQIGLSGASLLDPLTHTSSPVLANFLTLVTVTVLLTMNGHLGMISAVASSFMVLPLGAAVDLQSGAKHLLILTGTLFTLGLRFAAPVIAVVMIGNTLLAILSRVSPQLNMLAVAFPLQIGIGLLALGISMPYIATFFSDWPAIYNAQISAFFDALLPIPVQP